MHSACQTENRKRRVQRRSRYGCRNCKLRKLKCDEARPQCRKCSSFGVLCNFLSTVLDLQPTSGEQMVVQAKTEPQAPVSSAVWTSDGSISYQLNAKCQDFITRYLGRSLITPDDPNMVHVNRKLLKLAFAHPFLMHASLAVAYTYDRHLNGCRRSIEECYHWFRSTALFNKRLKSPVETRDKDAIWGTAAALTILAFSGHDATTPEESWPLKSSGPSDLGWVRMSKGKMSLWQVVNPLRMDSLFRVMAATFAEMDLPLPEEGIEDLPESLVAVCQLDKTSTAENNAYFQAAHALSHILGLPDHQVTTGPAQHFLNSIYGPFEHLLQDRDPVALLLLYLWYRKAGRSIWWIELRSRVECPAIGTYLKLFHKKNVMIQAFLSEDSVYSFSK